MPLSARDVSGVIQLGGTMLGSARSPEFKTEEGRRKAIRSLSEHGVEAAVVIGGNGSQTGSKAMDEMGFPVVGVASTIDNDLYGSDITIGVDTALNIALEAIDRLKTAGVRSIDDGRMAFLDFGLFKRITADAAEFEDAFKLTRSERAGAIQVLPSPYFGLPAQVPPSRQAPWTAYGRPGTRHFTS